MANLAKPIKLQPPLKGSFPLDHHGECTGFYKKFMKCLSLNNSENVKCREESKNYIECRMDKQLMTREPLSKIGFKEFVTDTEPS